MHRKFPLLLAFTFLVSQTFSHTNEHLRKPFETDHETSISEALFQIFEELGHLPARNIDIVSDAIETKSTNVHNDILNKILMKIASKSEFALCLHDSDHSEAQYFPAYNLLVVDGYGSFSRQVYGKIRKSFYSPRGFFIVILTVLLSDAREIVQKIFRELWSLSITNVVLLVHYAEFVQAYTFFPFAKTHCREVVPVLYNTFENGAFRRKVPVFPEKFNNIHGCPLNIATMECMPFINLTFAEDGRVDVGGIDGKLLKMLSETLNFQLSIQIGSEDEQRGTIFENGTSTGAFRRVIEGDCDFTMCGYGYSHIRATYMSASASYLDDDMLFASSMPRPYTAMERLLFPFEYHIWLVIMIAFAIGFFVTTVLKSLGKKYIEFVTGPRNRSATLQMINIYFGGSVPNIPRRNFARTMLISWMTLSIILRNSYQGSMFKYLQSRRLKPLNKSPKELIAMGYKVYIMSHWPSIVDLLQLKEGEYEMMDKPLAEYFQMLYEPGFKGITINTNSDLMYFNKLNRNRPTLRPLAEQLFDFPISIYFKKDSFLVQSFDRVLYNFMGSGLMQKWILDTLNRPYKEKDTQKPVASGLAFNDLIGTFKICSVLSMVSVAAFILELLTKISSRLRSIIDLSTY